MRKSSNLVFSVVLIISVLTVFSCKKDKGGIEVLPPATQEGKNTIGCLINGKALLPRKAVISTVPLFDCSYDRIDGKYYFHISMRDSKDPGLRSMRFNSVGPEINVGTYDLKSDEVSGITPVYKVSEDQGDGVEYTIRGNGGGKMTITKFDLINFIVSGTFWFDAESPDGQKVEVREGRFDMKL